MRPQNLSPLSKQQGADAAKNLGDLQAKIQAAQAQVDNATGDRDKVLAAVATPKSRLTDLQQQSGAAEKSLTALQQQGADAAKTLADQLAALQSQLSAAQAQVDNATAIG